MGDLVKNLVIWTIIAVVIMSLFTGVGGRNVASQEFNYTDFMQQVQTGQVEEVTISGREITVSVLGNESLPIIEIRPHSDVYDYKSKYTKGESDYICPANLDDSLSKDIQDTALRIHNLLDCKVYSRVDFRLDKDNRFWLLEINTLPGMTETSLFPMAAKIIGLNFEDLIDKIIKLSLEK